MTLCIGVVTSSGIVVSADSRQTYTNQAGAIRIGTDNARKLFQLPNNIAVAICGDAFFPDEAGTIKDAGYFIEAFGQSPSNKGSVREVAEAINGHLVKQCIIPAEHKAKTEITELLSKQGAQNIKFNERECHLLPYSFEQNGKVEERVRSLKTMTLIVAGYDKDGTGHLFRFKLGENTENNSHIVTKRPSALWMGQTDVVCRIVKGWAPELHSHFASEIQSSQEIKKKFDSTEYLLNWGTLNVQDAVDFCVLMTRTTESLQRFSDGTLGQPGSIPGVGGPVDIVLIQPGPKSFSWLRQKQLTVRDARES